MKRDGCFIDTGHIACKKCHLVIRNYSSSKGTSTLSRHLKTCKKITNIEGFTNLKAVQLPKEHKSNLKDKIVRFITSTFSSMRICEDKSFADLMQSAVTIGATFGNINIVEELPGRKACRSHLDQQFEDLQQETTELLKVCDAKAFTSDMWSCKIGHFLDNFFAMENFSIKEGQLSLIFFDDQKHTGENILAALSEEFNSLRCICHRFNAVISTAWKISHKN